MSQAKPFVAGNWKMFKTVPEARALAREVLAALPDQDAVEVAVCPPFPALAAVAEVLKDSRIAVGAQTMHWETEGAYTGEVSGPMLRAAGCRCVILGHSERRQYFHETDATVNRRTQAALAHGLTPIVCVGETLEERESDRTEAVVERQIRGALEGIPAAEAARLVVAYEPVWAIGTGRTATPEQAQGVHALLRALLADLADEATAASIPLLYGGSVKPENAGELFSQTDIDGGLIGGAALTAGSFAAIVKAAMPA